MKNVFITGADRGIGFALCRCFLDNGWQVFAGRFMQDWPQLDRLKEEYGERLSLINLDVGSQKSVSQAAKILGDVWICW